MIFLIILKCGAWVGLGGFGVAPHVAPLLIYYKN